MGFPPVVGLLYALIECNIYKLNVKRNPQHTLRSFDGDYFFKVDVPQIFSILYISKERKSQQANNTPMNLNSNFHRLLL